MEKTVYSIRPANKADLAAINRLIESAVMSWKLPERVIRLSLSSYRYDELDFEHLDMIVAQDQHQKIIAVAASEEADSKETPGAKKALLLHGLYVDPTYQHRGIGRQLFESLQVTAQALHYDGILVKAQQDAAGFFKAQDMEKCQVDNPARDYANRFWKSFSK
ncbi:MAG: GNAT family N-acetyltransferase [Gammaproteobacteria bacterium]|nr:GNAT family N-acetyltransferase [Gammaproteobacteria bacterium]